MNVAEIDTWVKKLAADVIPREKALSEAWWRANTTGRKEDEDAAAEREEEYRRLFTDARRYSELKTLQKALQNDPLVAPHRNHLSRQLLIFRNEFEMNRMSAKTVRELVRRAVEIESRFNNFRSKLRGEQVSDNHLKEILRTSDDSNLVREAWEASKQIGVEVAAKVLDLVRLRNKVARDNGYENFYVMSLRLNELEPDTLFPLLEHLAKITEKPYGAIKAKLDCSLAEKFRVTPEELCPWHYGDPFFQSAPVTSAFDLDRFYADEDLEALTVKFFNGIGLDVRDVLARSDLHEREGKCQHAFCTDIDRNGDVRVLCNLKANEHWMGTMLHEFGHAVYDKYTDVKLPHALRGPTHIFTTEAIAMLFGRLSQSVEFLTAIVGKSEEATSGVVREARELFCQNQLIFVRWGLVVVYFEKELYRDPEQDLDALWWKLVADLQHLPQPTSSPGGGGGPLRRHPDWAAKIHIATAPAYYQNYILGELMASQLSRHLLESVLNGASSLVNRPKVGKYLQENVFFPGRTVPWNDLVKRATGEELNPAYFLAEVTAEGPG